MWPRRKRTDEDFSEEIQANIALDTDRFVAEGMSPNEARIAALRAFGNVTRVQERFYESSRLMWLDELQRDLRYALRTLVRNPGFAAVAVLTLALGIGSTTVVFSVVDSIVLNPAPFKDPDHLAEIWRWRSRGGGPFQPSQMLPRWREQSQIFDQVEGHWESSFVISGDGEPQVLWGSQVTVGLFGMLGIRPALGRDFVSDESSSRVAIISHGLWMRRFGGDVDVVGKTLRLSDLGYTVVGVMPAGFRFPVGRIEVWIPFDPLRSNPLSPRGGGFTPIVRVRADVPFAQADEQVSMLAPRLDESLAALPAGATARLQTMYRYSAARLGRGGSITETRTALFLIFGAAGFVLLVSAANAANLFLSRGLSRGHDLAVRAALGGGRWRLVRHLLTEASVVALLAGTLGILMAGWTLRGVAALVPIDFSDNSLNPIDLDARAAVWSVVATMLVGLLAAIAPALQSVRGDIIAQLKKGRAQIGVHGPMAFRGLLVSVETGLAVVLLIGAGLAARSFWTLLQANPGWSADGLVVVEPQFQNDRYRSLDVRADYFTQLLRSLTDHPGVESAAIAEGVPLEPGALWLGKLEAGTSSTQEVEVTNLRVSDTFFRTMGIRIREGRVFAAREAGPVAVVSASIAQQLWAGETSIGRSFRFENSPELLTVVGVADDVQMQPFDSPLETMEIYRPLGSSPGPASVNQYHFAILRAEPRAGLIPLLKQRALAIDPNLPVRMTPMRDVFRGTLAEPEFQASLLIGFGAIALLLASAGVFAVVSYETSRRSQEIGIRVALGATSANVIRHVMGRSLRLATIGAAAGVGAAFALTRFMSSMLHGIQPTDAVAFVSATAFLLFAAAVAAYVPARRATRVDPMVALRCD